MSLLELLPSPVTPGGLEILVSPGASLVTPGALAQSCHSWKICTVVSLLELFPSQVYLPQNSNLVSGEHDHVRGDTMGHHFKLFS